MPDQAEALMAGYLRRMCNLAPMFVKELKERSSRWYNRHHDRRGTLWRTLQNRSYLSASRHQARAIRA